MTSVLWNELPARALNDLARRDAIVLLPVASTEQHGPHLATGVDAVLCWEACRRTAEIVSANRPIIVAPTVWMGLAEHHVAFGGTFTLSVATWHALLRDLCRSILRAGFKKILIVNGHGGNMSALNALTVELARELDAPIATTSYWTLAHDEGAFEPILQDQKGVQHACEAETSMMLAAAPDLVFTDELPRAVGPQSSMGSALNRPLHRWRSFKEITETGVLGDARRANAQKGERLLDTAARLMAERLIAGEPWA
jgi:creatinine amidohydrolase